MSFMTANNAEPIIKPFRLKSAEYSYPLPKLKETDNSMVVVNNGVSESNLQDVMISDYKEALEALNKDHCAFLSFSEEIIDAEGFIEDAMLVAPEIYWMANFPAVYYLKINFLLKAMDCENFNIKIFEALPKKLTHRINVMYKFFALDFLSANQFYFSKPAHGDRNDHECEIYTYKNSYLGRLISLFVLKDEVSVLNFDNKKGDNFSTYIYNYNGNQFIEKLANNRHAWTKAYIVYGNHLCFHLFLEGLNLEALNTIKATLIGEDGLGLKTAKDLISLVDDEIKYKSRSFYRRTVDGFKDSTFCDVIRIIFS